jgi:hypothetical protein
MFPFLIGAAMNLCRHKSRYNTLKVHKYQMIATSVFLTPIVARVVTMPMVAMVAMVVVEMVVMMEMCLKLVLVKIVPTTLLIVLSLRI